MKIIGRRAPPAPDAAVIRTLAGLLAETGLTEIEYAVGDTRIRLARGPSGVAVSAPVATNGAALPAATAPAAIQALPSATRSLYLTAFTESLHPVFLYAAAIGALGFALTWFLKEVPLRLTPASPPGDPQPTGYSRTDE